METWIVRNCFKNGKVRKEGDRVNVSRQDLVDGGWEEEKAKIAIPGKGRVPGTIVRFGTLLKLTSKPNQYNVLVDIPSISYSEDLVKTVWHNSNGDVADTYVLDCPDARAAGLIG